MTDDDATNKDDTEQAADVNYATFGQRLLALIMDALILSVITVPLSWSIYGDGYFMGDDFLKGPADFLINYVAPAIIVITFWTMKQATPGKMIMSIKIVDEATLEPASLGQLVGRYFGYILSMIPLCLGFIWVAFDKKRQGWHDRLARTVVIKETK